MNMDNFSKAFPHSHAANTVTLAKLLFVYVAFFFLVFFRFFFGSFFVYCIFYFIFLI
jgi:hypothetical protein